MPVNWLERWARIVSISHQKDETKMKRYNHLCLLGCYQYMKESRPCSNCGAQGYVRCHIWYDSDYANELRASGINQEYASQLAVKVSIKHQRRADSEPYKVLYQCDRHMRAIINTFLGKQCLFSDIYLSRIKANTSQVLYLYDANETETEFTPMVAVFNTTDIRAFIQHTLDNHEKCVLIPAF